MIVSIFLVFLGHLSYGISNPLWKNPIQQLGIYRLSMLRSAGCLLIFSSVYFFQLNLGHLTLPNVKAEEIFKVVGLCSVSYLGLLFYLKSLQHTFVSNTIGFGKLGLVLGILISVFFYDQVLTTTKLAACACILLAIVLIERATRTQPAGLSRGLVYSFLSRLFWTSGFLFALVIPYVGFYLFICILEAVVLIWSFVLFLAIKQPPLQPFSSTTWKEIFYLIFFGALGTFCLNRAVTEIPVLTLAFLGLLEPVIGIALSLFYFKEEISRVRWIGLVLGLISALVLNLA